MGEHDSIEEEFVRVTTSHHPQRVARLASLMVAECIDALALADPANVYLLSGAYGFGT